MTCSTRNRRCILKGSFLAAIASTAPQLGLASEPLRDTRYAQDFDELWNTLRDRYCFFDGKAVDWLEVRSLYRPMALAAGSDAAFTDIVRRVLSELYDAHTHLADPPPGTPRWPLFDLLVERAGTDIRIAAIAPDSAAADAGLAVGDVITEVGGTPVEQVVRDAAPKCLTRPDHAADSYAINVAAAGRRGQTRHFAIRSQTAASRNVSLAVKQRPDAPNVQSQRIDEALGYIAIRSFADPTVVEAFDNALAGLRESRGLVIDVRQNGGGDTAVARPIMGRFLSEQKPYALMRRRERAGLSAPWREWVDPRGPFTYGGRVIVLVDPWSASLAEGFAMGMRGLERAMIVGTPMMGLGAAVFAIRLDRTGIQAQYSAEPVYDVTGQPRWTLRPDVNVPSGGDIMAAGIATARAQI